MSTTSETRGKQKERMTLPKAFRTLWTHPSPWVLAIGLVTCWSVRITLGEWLIWDALILAGLVAVWPFVEWVIHVFVLHMKPFQIAGKTVDLHLSSKHRAHHQDPDDLTHVFIPIRSLLISLPFYFLVAWLVMPTTPLMFTALAGLFTMGIIYEWCHFLIHTNYRAKTRFYKRLWRHHRLHHFKHEENWFGVSTTMGDKVLGTAPNFREIETSPNCRTLGVNNPVE